MSIGHSPNEAPHMPDMRKENPSMAEKQDAKRRIEGSFAPSTRAMPSAANMQ
jgi:phosphatidylserine decarboxylase